jgi:DNA-binding transcriptional MerR regulator
VLDLERTHTSRLPAMTTLLTIQQAAATTGLSVHTLRYYERIGLLDPILRQDNTHRLFRPEDLRWIGFLLKLRSTGLPIRDMLRYAQLRRQGDTPESVSARKALLLQHTQTVEQTLAELQNNLAILHQKIAMYDSLETMLPANVIPPSSSPESVHHEHRHSSNLKHESQHQPGPAGQPRRRAPARR